MKINNQRSCLYSNKKYDKSELIRLIKQNNKLVIDIKKNLLGRGYWLKLTKDCLSDPKLITILSKRTRSSVDEKLIEKLKEIYNEKSRKNTKNGWKEENKSKN